MKILSHKTISFGVIAFFIISSLLFTSCGKTEVSDSSGNIIEYTSSDILNDSEKDGFYVLNKDGIASPLMESAEGFDSTAEESSPTRFIYWNNNDNNYDNLIPTLTDKDSIIGVFSYTGDIPTDIVLEKYEDRGYTIGTHISVDVDGSTVLLDTSSFNGSDIKEKIENKNDSFLTLDKINDQDVPLDNIDKNMNFILGLEKDKKYNLKFYSGTKYTDVETIADTHVMQSSKIIKLSNPYETTKKGFFKVNIPSDLEEGYYYFSNLGLFKYEK